MPELQEGAEEESPHPALVEALLLDGQALPQQEHVVLLADDLQGFRRWQRHWRTREKMKNAIKVSCNIQLEMWSAVTLRYERLHEPPPHVPNLP